ncbi:hypothetical protein GCM10017673_46300 [Streptosporangium violaceochromogenes]|nr:hypothetical protein GCM10017673_46300 [Streptosporangium violaceochromogenes]
MAKRNKKKDDQDDATAAALAKAFWKAALPEVEPAPRRRGLTMDEFLEIFDE